MFRSIRRALVLAVVLMALAAVVPVSHIVGQTYGTGRAEAVGLSGAESAALYESFNYCPHHRFAECMARRHTVLYGTGGGRWVGQAESWECVWFEPCSYNAFNSAKARQQARWYGVECFDITASGGIANRGRQCY